MCDFIGFINLEKNIDNKKNTLEKMNSVIPNSNNLNKGYYIDKDIALCNTDTFQNSSETHQPRIETFSFGNYVIVLNGQIYNISKLKAILIENNFNISSDSSSEIILKSYIYYGKKVVNHLNGSFSFAIWDTNKKELFISRDHFGLKPFYYTILDKTFIFSTQLKCLLEYPGFEKILDAQCINELIGIGPAHTPGLTVFKNVFELKPAHLGIFNSSGLHLENYWKLESKEHTDSLGQTCDYLKFLLQDSISNQLQSDKKICTFLSGGLDSSIISKFVSDYFKKENLEPLNTYSVNYVDNDKNFVKSDFQPNSDDYYIELMNKVLYSNHHNIFIDTPELVDSLYLAMEARDMPGMADIDSSLLLFCKNVVPNSAIALTGECADEIFGGYPWFFRKDALESNTFPWSISIDERQNLLNPSISNRINLKDYIDFRYNESLSNVDILESDSFETAKKRKISYLTLNWFMQTLLERSERMAKYSGFEIRVPFCDYRLAQYVWNIPWEWKALKGREKGLLRFICRDFLPVEIIDRKKSPYPKTHNPTYSRKVKELLNSILKDKNAPIRELLNIDYIDDILKSDGKIITRPWFGQLMVGPQLIAYICQINMWLEKYQPKIEL